MVRAKKNSSTETYTPSAITDTRLIEHSNVGSRRSMLPSVLRLIDFLTMFLINRR